MRVASLVFLAALGAGGAALAQDPPASATAPAPQGAPQTAPATPPAKPVPPKPSDLDRLICKRKQEMDTRFPGKAECHSKRWWEEQASIYRQDMDSNMSHQHGVDQH